MNVPTVITPPASEPITLPEAKAHLRAIGTNYDYQIGMMITPVMSNQKSTCSE